jgi:hypothetical protein
LSILSILLLIGISSCESTQENIYVITFNDGGECEDYSLEIDCINYDKELAEKRLKNIKQHNSLEDPRLYCFKENNTDFLYFTENFDSCVVKLKEVSVEEADFSLYIRE